MTATEGLTAQEYEVLREHLTKTAYERGYEDGYERALDQYGPTAGCECPNCQDHRAALDQREAAR